MTAPTSHGEPVMTTPRGSGHDRDASALVDRAERAEEHLTQATRKARAHCLTSVDMDYARIHADYLAQAERNFAAVYYPGRRVFAIAGTVNVAEVTGDCRLVFERTPQVVAS